MNGIVKGLMWVLGLAVIAAALALVAVGMFGEKSASPTVQTAAMGRLCPPPVSIPPRGPGAPVDDMLGVRLGFTPGDVEATLLCLNEDYKFYYEQAWHTMAKQPDDSMRQSMRGFLGDKDELSVGLVGEPGQERVFAVFRRLAYPLRADVPTLASVEADLIQHFGPPHLSDVDTYERTLSWAYDPEGRPLKVPPKDGANIFNQMQDWVAGTITAPACMRHAKLSILEQPTWDVNCGITVKVQLKASLEDPTKIGAIQVGLVDQKRLATAVVAFRTRRDVAAQLQAGR